MANPLAKLPAIVSKAIGPMLSPATLNKPGAAAADGRGGRTHGAATEHACSAIVTNYSDAIRGMSNGVITLKDRKAIVAALTLPAGIVPAIDDGFTIGGDDWKVIAVKRDPAEATYTLQIRPLR